jgi:rhodanese-related sulfurtransferase
MRQIPARELADWLSDDNRADPMLLDVREPWEFQLCNIAGSRHIPMGVVPARLDELERDRDIVVICHHGGRSAQVAIFLERQGFANVINLSGGVAGWAASVDPSMPQY